MDVIVRHAVPGDVAKCFKLWRDLVTAEAGTFTEGAAYPQPNLDDPEAMGAWFGRFSHAMTDQSSRYWVAEVGDEIVGFLLAEHCQREVGEPKYFMHASEMYLKPEHRGGDAYKALEDALELWAEQLNVDVIECAAVFTEKQMGRWISRGFTPYMVNLYRNARWKDQA